MPKVMTYINRLLNKFREGKYSDTELNELIDLMKIPTYEDAANSAMYKHWKECENTPVGDEERFKQILNEIHHNINLKSRKTFNLNQYYLKFSRIAAILILPLAISFYLLGLFQNTNRMASMENTITVPLGATSQFILPDGTEVMLNSGSTLKYPLSFEHKEKRSVSLDGEGFFKVSKDKSKPFLVNLNGMDIKVTGTTFNARAYNDESNIIVALAEGSVLLGKQISDSKFDSKSGLKPKDVAVFNKQTNKLDLYENTDLTKYLAWTRGLTVFDNDPIQTVVEKLEKLYNIEVIIQDKELLNYRLTATFTSEPLEQALNIISLSSAVNYHIVADKRNNDGAFGKRTLILKKRKR